MKREIITGLVFVCAAGAATAQVPGPSAAPTVSAPAAADARPTITYVYRDKLPPFQDKTVGATAFTAGLGSLGGLAGAAIVGGATGAAQLSAGSETSAADAFPNPDNLIAKAVAVRVAPALGATLADEPATIEGVKLEGSRQQKYAQLAGKSRYLVGVEAMIFRSVWASYATWPLDFQHYILEYMGKVEIYDVKESKEVFSGRCFVFTNRAQPLPTHDELFANQGAILKTFIGQAANDCVAQLQDKNDQFKALVGPAPKTN